MDGTTEQIHTISATTSFVRKLAESSSEADRKLRQMCPQAFEPRTVRPYVASDAVLGAALGEAKEGTLLVDEQGEPMVSFEGVGRYEGIGLHLDGGYDWAIIDGPYGWGKTLLARERA